MNVIIGLSVGISAAFLIFVYVYSEKSYDNFHERGDDLYRIVVTNKAEGKDAYKSPYSYILQGPIALTEIPEVENYVRLMSESSISVSDGSENTISETFSIDDYYFTESSFFELFSFSLIQGNPKTVLQEPGSVAISQSLSEKVFGTQSAIGKVLMLNNTYPCTVTGIFKDIPYNSHLKFDALFSLNAILSMMQGNEAWANHSFFTYLLLRKGTDPKSIEPKLTSSFHSENRAIYQMECQWELQPVKDAYLKTSDFTSKPKSFKFGNNRVVYFLMLIAIIILCISWINYINLITVKATDRIKEIGIRKTNGAGRRQLIIQFFSESILFNMLSILIAAFLIIVVFKWFISLLGTPVSFLQNIGFWSIIASILLIGILIPGILSASLLSSYNTVRYNHISYRTSPLFSFRGGLVIFQFMIIIGLMIGVLFINKQLRHIQSIDLGFQKDQILVIHAPRFQSSDELSNKLKIFREELLKSSAIKDVTASVSIPGERFGAGNGGPQIIGHQNEDTYFRIGRVMPNYLDFYKIKLIAGQNFEEKLESNDQSVIINAEAVKEFGFKDPNEIILKKTVWANTEFTIIGVTQSFHQESLHIKPEPMIIYTRDFENSYNYISVKMNGNKVKESIDQITEAYSSIFPNNQCNFFFQDKYFDKQYQKDILFRKMFSMFSILALIIGYFGLYGVITFRIAKRTKEIGIRKVNGARTLEVMALIYEDFIKWILVAFLFSCPIAWYAMSNWMQNFAYKTELNWWVFLAAGIIALLIASLTVSWQSWRAATRNPVEALRYE